MLHQLALLMGFQLIGEAAVKCLGVPFPGPLCGMLLLLCYLQLRGGPLREAFAATAAGDGAIGARGIAVPLAAQDGGPHVAHVLPLTSGARRQAGNRYAAVAAVFLQPGAATGTTPFETIARHFKLTPAELRVLFAIVQVGGVPEVAPVLGISATTVKTHLQHVFEKTGANRQADLVLVKLVAGFMSPLEEQDGGVRTIRR